MRNIVMLVTAMAAMVLFGTGCTEIVISSKVKFSQGGDAGGSFNPATVPRLVALTPNSGPESGGTDFVIEGVNMLPQADVDVDFGGVQMTGRVNAGGTQIVNIGAPNQMFTTPAGTGTVDIVCTFDGQNPPTLSLPNAFVYMPPGAPASPTVSTMVPNTDTEFGGTTMVMTGTNVPVASGYTIVVSFLFGSGTENVAATQTIDDEWECIVPAVPTAQNFQTGTLDVTVTVTFAGGSPALPAPIVDAAPQSTTDGNPFTYTHTGTPPAPPPEEYVVASGLWAPNSQNTPDSFVRTVQTYDVAYDTLTTATGLQARYMFNGAERLAPNGTHSYPAPLAVGNNIAWRDANSSFSHFDLPEFDRTYEPAVPQGATPATPVTKPVTAALYHCTNVETSGNVTGSDDSFFAVYSNGEVEVFQTGSDNIHEEIAVHEDFRNYPYFAVVHDSATPRVYVGRLDGDEFVASSANTTEVNCNNVNGEIKPLSLQLAGEHLYFATDSGDVYHAPVDSGSAGVNPVATALNWPSGAVHTYVADEFNLSGDGTTICFIAGTGTQRYTTAGSNPPDTHNVFAIRNADAGNTNIIAVTDFAAPGKQIQMWNIDDGTSSTYGSMNVNNGANDRRVYQAGINAFSNSTNRPGSDVVVNQDGELCAFVTREDREVVDGTIPAFVVYYLYVARIGQGVNEVRRINSFTGNEFGIGAVFASDMTVIPGFYFPKETPNNGMKYRLVFSVATVAGTGTPFEQQHIYTADVSLSTGGIAGVAVNNRSELASQQPFDIGSTAFHYFGGFQSASGHVYFVIEVNSGKLQYIDLRDGVTSIVSDINRGHDGAPVTLPVNSNAGNINENTYLPSGFAPDPNGSTGLPHWANQLRSLHGPGLNQFTSEYLLFVHETNTDEEDVYILQMNSISSPLPSNAINVTNIAGAGVIRGVHPSNDGQVLAVVKGTGGYPEGYRFSGTTEGELYIVNDVPGMLAANDTVLSQSAQAVSVVGNKFSRQMKWYEDNDRYSLYFGEGSSVGSVGSSTPPRSILRFTRIDIDRTNANMISAPVQIDTIDGTALDPGAVYIYEVGKLE